MAFWKTFLAARVPDNAHEALVSAVEYQLSCLLNSEAPLMSLPAKLQEVEKSNLRFGLDNLHSISSLMDKEAFSRQVEKWVMAFEPRLSAVTVEVYQRDAQRNRISFSLLAQLKTERGLHTLTFDSSINLTDQRVEIEGQDLV